MSEIENEFNAIVDGEKKEAPPEKIKKQKAKLYASVFIEHTAETKLVEAETKRELQGKIDHIMDQHGDHGIVKVEFIIKGVSMNFRTTQSVAFL